jgi:hypothetical protein
MDKFPSKARVGVIRDAIGTAIALLIGVAIWYVAGLWLWRTFGG